MTGKNENVAYSKSECDLELYPNGNDIRIECYPDSLRVIDMAQYIKMHVVAPKGKSHFRVKIIVESILDYKSNRYDMEKQSERLTND